MEILGAYPWGLIIGLAAGSMAVLVLLAARARRLRQRLGGPPASLKAVAEARWELGEASASAIAEQIEEMANRALADHSDHPKVRVDFGTAADGSLEIWVESKCYQSVDAIPDTRVREAVTRAVAEFNR